MERVGKDTALAVQQAAREAGKIVLDFFGKAEAREKGEKNLVTEADVAVESFCFERLRPLVSGAGFLAEEAHTQRPDEEYMWVVDPIDGTNNYAHGYPFFCVSIALMYRGRTVLAVVYDPLRDEMFFADEDGSLLNGRPIRVSNIEDIGHALLCTGFAYGCSGHKDDNISHFRDFVYAAQGVRRDGSAALDLCYVACGRFDGFWELNLSPWDTAAGYFIAQKAGAVVTDFHGAEFDIFSKEICASNGRLHKKMLDILNEGRI